MKGSLCNLPKRRERKVEGEEKSLEPHHSSFATSHATTEKLSVHCFKRHYGTQCFTARGANTRLPKGIGFSPLLTRALHAQQCF
jgi:hypothetical protein